MSRAAYKNSSRARTDLSRQQNQLSTQVVFHRPRHISGSLAILLFPKVLEPCESDSVQVLRRVTLATTYGNPECLPLSNPTKSRKLGLLKTWLNMQAVTGRSHKAHTIIWA
jgi:hypothetical protein